MYFEYKSLHNLSFALNITETKILYGTWLYAEVAALKDWGFLNCNTKIYYLKLIKLFYVCMSTVWYTCFLLKQMLGPVREGRDKN